VVQHTDTTPAYTTSAHKLNAWHPSSLPTQKPQTTTQLKPHCTPAHSDTTATHHNTSSPVPPCCTISCCANACFSCDRPALPPTRHTERLGYVSRPAGNPSEPLARCAKRQGWDTVLNYCTALYKPHLPPPHAAALADTAVTTGHPLCHHAPPSAAAQMPASTATVHHCPPPHPTQPH
jgi:hypothetical protein